MSKSRDRGKKIALASGLGVLAIAGMLVVSWDGLVARYVGYRFVWLPEGAVPTNTGQSINASGEVALDLRLEPQGRRAGRWSLATRDVLPLDVPRFGGESSIVFAINDAGDIVGSVSTGAPLRGSLPARPFWWTKDAGVRDISNLAAQETVVTAINERGQVVGFSRLPWNNVSRAFLWSAKSGIAYLGSLAPGKLSVPSAINESGCVVGFGVAANGSRHPFLWKPESGMQDLGLPSGFSSGEAGHINDKGDVLVSISTKCTSGSRKGTYLHRPFIWREKDGFVKLPAPPGLDLVWAVALNNRGTVLLQAATSEGRHSGYLIVNGVLKEIPGAPGAKANRYCGLNDKGWLVGKAKKNDENTPWRGFLALPVR